MVYIFHFLQTGMVFENVNPFSWIFYAISSEKSCLILKPFLTCLLDARSLDFSRLLNPDWTIQIPSMPAVCKETPHEHTKKLIFFAWVVCFPITD